MSKKSSKVQDKTATGEPFCTRIAVQQSFTPETFKAKGEELGRKMQEVKNRTERLKADTANSRADIKLLQAEVDAIGDQLRNGYEIVAVEAFVAYHRKEGKKRYFYNAPGQAHHNQLIREEAMTEADYQQLIPLPEEPAQPAAN